MITLTEKFISSVRKLPTLSEKEKARKEFRLWADIPSKVESYYAPFDYLNATPRIVLIGITPGATQMNNALNALNRSATTGEDIEVTLRRVKRTASFSGNMRKHAVAILNKIGIPSRFGIVSSAELWDTSDHLVHFCSLLKYPVFKNRMNYNDSPRYGRDKIIDLLLDDFCTMLNALPEDALIIPFGDKVSSALKHLRMLGKLKREFDMTHGLILAPPHPSPENIESINLFLAGTFPELHDYVDHQWACHLSKKLNQGKAPQNETTYKKTRATRWETMRIMRAGYGLPV